LPSSQLDFTTALIDALLAGDRRPPARPHGASDSSRDKTDVSERPIDRLLHIMSRLRGPGGCPWDHEQTLQTLKPFMVEECYEVVDAIDDDDAQQHCDELGDLLLQIVFQSQIRSEDGAFAFDDVATAISEKLVRRHPHVFGDRTVSGSDEVVRNWEAIKDEEKMRAGAAQDASVLDGVPRHLPALQRARKVQSRASRAGFDWPDESGVVAKLDEEMQELKQAIHGNQEQEIGEELGDLLFSVVNLCRFHGFEAEDVLEQSTRKFSARFREVERRVHAAGHALKDCSPDDLDNHWEAVKAQNAS
jgi:tetrapyrrole methylase family protein/MazG family protein